MGMPCPEFIAKTWVEGCCATKRSKQPGELREPLMGLTVKMRIGFENTANFDRI